jgi:hypothetical protein
MNLIPQLQQRFGAHRVRQAVNPLHPEQAIVFLYLELQVPVTVLMTCGLSDYEMPVSEKWKGREHNELFFCLPAYWDFDDLENPNFNWVYDWLFRLESFVREKQTWFGPGHTIPCGNPPAQISETMKHEYFILLDPIFLQETMAPLNVDGKQVHFLSIVPLFGDELDFKMAKGTTKQLLKRFMNRKIDERLDDYRASVMKSRMRFF